MAEATGLVQFVESPRANSAMIELRVDLFAKVPPAAVCTPSVIHGLVASALDKTLVAAFIGKAVNPLPSRKRSKLFGPRINPSPLETDQYPSTKVL